MWVLFASGMTISPVQTIFRGPFRFFHLSDLLTAVYVSNDESEYAADHKS
jgi:hypothetical protein